MKGNAAPKPPRAHRRVRVQPGARVAGIVGVLADGTIRMRVTAAPEAGRANRAVVTLLAGVLGVRETQVRVTHGVTTRGKGITIDGLDDVAVDARIRAALETGTTHDE